MVRNARRGIWPVTLPLAILYLLISGRTMAADSSSRQLTIFLTSGIAGQLEREGGTNVAALVAELRRQTGAARAAGHDVVVLDAGRTVAPFADSGFDHGETMFEVLEAAGHQAFVPTFIDFTLGIGRLAGRAEQASFPVVRPFAVLNPATEKLARVALLTPTDDAGPVDDLKVLVASVFKPAENVEGTGLEDLRMLAPGEAFEGYEDEPAIRIGIAHRNSHGSHLVSHEYTWGVVEDPRGIDLLIHPSFGYQVTLRHETDRGPMFLAGLIRDRSWRIWRLDLDLEREDEAWRIRGVTSEALPVPLDAPEEPEIGRVVRATMDRFHQVFDDPLPPGAATMQQITDALAADEIDPTVQAQLERFVLEAAREAAGTEIAILSRGALRPVAQRLLEERPIREEAVVNLLSLDQGLVRTRLTGDELIDLIQESSCRVRETPDGGEVMANSGLCFHGLNFACGDLRFKDQPHGCGLGPPPAGSKKRRQLAGQLEVNGRALHPEDYYLVVTSRFLITGGDNYSQMVDRLRDRSVRNLRSTLGGPLAGTAASSTRQYPTLELRRDVAMPRLKLADEPFPDLDRRVLYRYGVERISLTMKDVSTDRDDAYRGVDSRAGASDSFSLSGDVNTWLDLEWAGWKMENTLSGKFGLVELEGVSNKRETNDELSFETRFAYFRKPILGGAFRYLNLQVDTEFRPNTNSRGLELPRELEFSVGTGLVWKTKRWPRIRLGLLARTFVEGEERDVGDPGGPSEFIIEDVHQDVFGGVFSARYLRQAKGSVPGIDADFYFEHLENSELDLERIDVNLRLLVPIYGGLSVSPSFNFYQYTDSRLTGSADYFKYSLALVYRWQSRYQAGTVSGPKMPRQQQKK